MNRIAKHASALMVAVVITLLSFNAAVTVPLAAPGGAVASTLA